MFMATQVRSRVYIAKRAEPLCVSLRSTHGGVVKRVAKRDGTGMPTGMATPTNRPSTPNQTSPPRPNMVKDSPQPGKAKHGPATPVDRQPDDMATHQATGDGLDDHSDSEMEEGEVPPGRLLPQAEALTLTESEGSLTLPLGGLLTVPTGRWTADLEMELETTASSRRAGDLHNEGPLQGDVKQSKASSRTHLPAIEATAPGADDDAAMTPVADQASAAPHHLQHKLLRVGEAQLVAREDGRHLPEVMPTASTAAAAKVTPDEGQASIEALFTFTDTEIEEAQPLKVPRGLAAPIRGKHTVCVLSDQEGKALWRGASVNQHQLTRQGDRLPVDRAPGQNRQHTVAPELPEKPQHRPALRGDPGPHRRGPRGSSVTRQDRSPPPRQEAGPPVPMELQEPTGDRQPEAGHRQLPKCPPPKTDRAQARTQVRLDRERTRREAREERLRLREERLKRLADEKAKRAKERLQAKQDRARSRFVVKVNRTKRHGRGPPKPNFGLTRPVIETADEPENLGVNSKAPKALRPSDWARVHGDLTPLGPPMDIHRNIGDLRPPSKCVKGPISVPPFSHPARVNVTKDGRIFGPNGPKLSSIIKHAMDEQFEMLMHKYGMVTHSALHARVQNVVADILDDRDPKGRPLRSTKTECVTPRDGEPVWYVSEKELGEIPKFMCREVPTVYHGTKPGDPEVKWDFTRPAGRTPGAPDAWDVLKNSNCKSIPLYVISQEDENEDEANEHGSDHQDDLQNHQDQLESQPTNQDHPPNGDDNHQAQESLSTKDTSQNFLHCLEKGLSKLIPLSHKEKEIWKMPPPISNPTAEELEQFINLTHIYLRHRKDVMANLGDFILQNLRGHAYTVTAGYIATNEKNNIPVTWDVLTQFWRDTYGAADPRVVVRKKLKHMSFTGGKLSTYVNEIQRLHTLLRDEPQSEFHKVMDFLDSIKIKDLKPLIEWDPETHERWADLDKCLNWVRRHYGDKEYKSPQGDNPHKRPHT